MRRAATAVLVGMVLAAGALPATATGRPAATSQRGAGQGAVVVAARQPVPQGTTYWRDGSALRVLKRTGNTYRYAKSGSGYECERGTISGTRTKYRWAELINGSAESDTSTGRMWTSTGRLYYRNATLTEYSLPRAAATSANRAVGARALAKCAKKLG